MESGLPSPPSPRSSVASDCRRRFPFRAARSPRGGCILKTTSYFFSPPCRCVRKRQTREMKNNAPFRGSALNYQESPEDASELGVYLIPSLALWVWEHCIVFIIHDIFLLLYFFFFLP